MQYSVIYNGKAYDLPQYSFAIAEKLEKQESINLSGQKFKEKCKSMYNLISDLIGKENVLECIGEFEDADANDINILYLEIVNQYNAPLTKYNADKTSEVLNVQNIDKLVELFKAVEKMEKSKK